MNFKQLVRNRFLTFCQVSFYLKQKKLFVLILVINIQNVTFEILPS